MEGNDLVHERWLVSAVRQQDGGTGEGREGRRGGGGEGDDCKMSWGWGDGMHLWKRRSVGALADRRAGGREGGKEVGGGVRGGIVVPG